MACVLFAIAVIPIFRLYSEQGLGQQKMIRDYAVALNIVENALNLIENEVERGGFVASFTDQDVTAVVLGTQAAKDAVRNFVGESGASTQYMPSFKILLTARPYAPELVELRLKFLWGRQTASGSLHVDHRFELCTLKARR